jgi:thiamine biosynthesis lipoprotein
MSTHCQIKVQSENSGLVDRFMDMALEWVAAFEAKYSRFLEASLISEINRAAGRGWVAVDAEADALFDLCQDMIFFTRGVFDPTALPLMKLWNWRARPLAIPSSEKVAATMDLVGWNKVRRRKGAIFLPREGMMLDLGGIGKEYAVDRVVDIGLAMGLSDLLVDFGQDVRTHGNAPGNRRWNVGLENPLQPGSCWASLAVNDMAIATSGDYTRHTLHDAKRLGHIIDPRSGYPVDNGARAVSILAPYCTFAGILSTAAFILGPKEGFDIIRLSHGIEGAIVTDKDCFPTRGFMDYATKQN